MPPLLRYRRCVRARNKPSRRHSSVRGKAGSFLRPAQPSGGRRAQRRSRAAAGRRLRLALDGREHGGIAHAAQRAERSCQRSKPYGPRDVGDGLRARRRSEAHARARLAPIGRRTVGSLGAGRTEPESLFQPGRSDPGDTRQLHCAASYVWVSPGFRYHHRKSQHPSFCHAATSRWQPFRSPSTPVAARRIRVSKPIRPSARLRFIAAHGSSRTSNSRPTSRHRLPRVTRRISTCRRAPAPRFSTRLADPPLDTNTPAVDATDASR